MRRVVVTGLGAVTPLGAGVSHVWHRLLRGESGVQGITTFDVSDLSAKIAGIVPRTSEPKENRATPYHFNAHDFVSSKEQRKMDDFIVLAIAAAAEAVADSGW